MDVVIVVVVVYFNEQLMPYVQNVSGFDWLLRGRWLHKTVVESRWSIKL